ncbi:hypothetical protein [Rhodospirillum centenum]|nr:hypothetical protein [Rhodospirillum centenum]
MSQATNQHSTAPEAREYPSLAFIDPESVTGGRRSARYMDAMDDAACVVAFVRYALTEAEEAMSSRERSGLAVLLRAVENSLTNGGVMIHMLEEDVGRYARDYVRAFAEGRENALREARAAATGDDDGEGDTYPKLKVSDDKDDAGRRIGTGE